MKLPPAMRLPPLTASASTLPFTPLPVALAPLPSADQVLPFHWATWFARTLVARLLKAVMKSPPTKRLPPLTASARTRSFTPLPVAPAPLPSADQVLPFHWATRFARTPVARL